MSPNYVLLLAFLVNVGDLFFLLGSETTLLVTLRAAVCWFLSVGLGFCLVFIGGRRRRLVIKLLHSNWPSLSSNSHFHSKFDAAKLLMSSIDSTRHLLEGYLLIDYSNFTFFLLCVVTLVSVCVAPGQFAD